MTSDSTAAPSMEEQLAKLLPRNIDDVIKANRDRAALRLATRADTDALRRAAPIQAVKAIVTRWSLVALELRDGKGDAGVSVFLMGYNETAQSQWMTSRVLGIDEPARLYATNSGSLYRVEGLSGEPDLPYLCATLNTWGIGRLLGLPPFFF